MNYAINLNAVLPVRATATEKSEMISQLLFGENCEVLNESNSFVEIKNSADAYIGWVDKKMLTEISKDEFLTLANEPVFRTCVPIADVFCLSDKTIHRLSAGSLLPHYNDQNSKFEIAGLVFQIHPSFVTYLPQSNIEGVVPTAIHFLNTPYLWGGKNIFGIDCSGLAQVVFSINGILLPRDTHMQVNEGVAVASIEDAEANDLLFFEKEGKIHHVGIYLGNQKVIHASGCVKIDKVDAKGIYSEKNSTYTHSLSTIRRF